MSDERYRILERIDAGGMAEVFRGVATSIRGFDKTVAIKRVLPELTRKPKFVRMFLDEARLSLGLGHGNIVQVFDVGHADETYFIVMEYVDGTNLKLVIEEAFDLRATVPIPHAVFIMAEVCKGLSYAHDLKDTDGVPINIVHRDISPPNILLSRQGEVKITDFGLAKARSQLEHTDPGYVKGKFAYLSPEAAYGESIDARTDIFAAGIVLWEMLAGRRLFAAESDQKTLDRIRKARVPELTRYNSAIPDELEAIVRKALARDRAMRFRSAGEMGNALTHFLFDHNLKVNSDDIAELVGHLLHEPEREKRPQTIDRMIAGVIQDEIDRFISLDADAVDDSYTGAVGGGFEDPSTWFDGATTGLDEPEQSLDVKGFRIGPEVDAISTVIPIDVVAKLAEEQRAEQEAEREAMEEAARAEEERRLATEEEARRAQERERARREQAEREAAAKRAAAAQASESPSFQPPSPSSHDAVEERAVAGSVRGDRGARVQARPTKSAPGVGTSEPASKDGSWILALTLLIVIGAIVAAILL